MGLKNKKSILTETEKNEIKTAVASAENKTAGEIMPVIARRSSSYPAPEWRGGAITAVLTAAALCIFWLPGRAWSEPKTLDYLLPLVLCAGAFAAGYFAVNLIPFLERLLSSSAEIDDAIGNAVFREFMVNDVVNTRDRSGVLIYVSLFERRVQILADSGINAKVDQSAWKEAVDEIATGIKKGELSRALSSAIGKIGEMLATHFPVKSDDTNELGDLIIRD